MKLHNFEWRKNIGITLIAVLCIIVLWKIFITPNPKGMSPKNIVKLYYKARNSGDTELLKQIMYFEPGTTDEQKQSKAESLVAGADEKLIVRSLGLIEKIKYQKYLDENTAEIGTVSSSIFKPWTQHPADQIILKKVDGVWKYHHSMSELPKEALMQNLKNHPENTDLYFHLARAYIPENQAKAHRYYLKYYELAPKGFWVDEDYLRRLKEYRKEFENTEIYEKEMLTEINERPDHILSKTIKYQRLCQLFIEKKDYKKATSYLMLAEETLKKDNSEYNYWKENLNKTKTELQLHIEGKYVDILDEIEAKQSK